MDTEELYRENLQKNYSEMLKYKWVDTNIDYTFNSEGFRCCEFSTDPSILFLGCSHTIGIGINIEDSWTTIVSNKLNLKCFNLGIGGSSCDTAFRIGHYYIEQIKPKIVVFLRPSQYRMEAINMEYSKPIMLYGPHGDQNLNNTDYMYHYFNDDNNGFLNREKNTLALNTICDKNHVKYIVINSEELVKVRVDRARDLAHCGTKTNLIFAYKVLDLI